MEPRFGTSFTQILKRSAQMYPDKTAITEGERRQSYRELLTHVNQLSNALARSGIGPGSRVAIISRNCMEYLETEFALYQLGAAAIKINWRMTAREISYILRENRAVMAFHGAGLMASAQELSERDPDIRFLSFPADGTSESEFAAFCRNESMEFADRPVTDPMLAMIVHTSGTTGTPKFVSYTHGDLLKKLRISLEVLPFTPETHFLLIEQLFHIACMRSYMCLGAGGTLTLLSHFEPEAYLATLERERITSTGMIPAVLRQILDHPKLDQYDISSLQIVNYTTCAMPYPLILQAMERLHCGFYQVYGMTEMLGLVTVLTPEDHLSGHITSVGRAVDGYKIKILRDDRSTCEPGEVGEVLIHGTVMMEGYLNNQALSQEILEGGWYHTRDLGFLDAGGYLHICGRKDDLIISGGENIYPQEIVDILMELESDIADVAVYGLPDPIWGEKVWASVVLCPGSSLTEEALKAYCRQKLANYKVPKGFDFRKSLPKNATGKTVLAELMRKHGPVTERGDDDGAC